MQLVSLVYLKSLVAENSFQVEGIKPDAYSNTTAILNIFLSDEEHQSIEHVHTSSLVHHEGCHLYMQDRILSFVKSIEVDLKKARDQCAQNKAPGGVHSYSLLIANYGGVMAISTNPPHCLVYPTVYNNDVEDQNHFNTAASPSGMCTHSCICCTLLQHADKDPVHWRTYEGSCLVIPHGTQYRTLFPEIVGPHNHWGLLIDHKTCAPWETSASWIQSFQAVLGTVSCSRRMTSIDSRGKVSVSSLQGGETSAHCPQGGQTQVSPHQGECTKLLQQRGGISQDQW